MSNIMLIFGFLALYAAAITHTHAADTISSNQIVRYNETIISPQETFEFGFFNPDNSTNYYVGIWYKNITPRTVVWVANRNTPLNHTSGELTLTLQGVLLLRDATNDKVIWSSANSSETSSSSPIGQLLDTGNFIIYKEGESINQEDPIWQSFDFMTNTLLPGMKQGWDLVTGIDRYFTSWKSIDDPALGEFTYRVGNKGYPQLILMDGTNIMNRAGPWNGLGFSGISNLRSNPIYYFTFVLNQREAYYQYNLIDSSAITRLVLQPDGRLERFMWIDSKQEWNLYLTRQNDLCDRYALCGRFGSCNVGKSPVCECLKKFEPTSPDQWSKTDWSQGCRHTIPLNCEAGEGFNKYTNLKLPDTQGSWYNQTMTLVECEKMCKSNCSCSAYTNSNISGTGSGCLLWFGDLIDISTLAENGDTLYIRLSASELGNSITTNSHAADTINSNQIIRYNETIISPLETFELGFFNPDNSTKYYVGIWYKKISPRTVVWVANRNAPLTNTSGELRLTLQGVLILRDATNGNVVWSSTNSSATSVTNPTGQLLDSGNFIIYKEGDKINQEDPIWQSFDFMTDTLLPGMKQGWDLDTGIDRRFTSWKSHDDPAIGKFSYQVDNRGYPQLLVTEGRDIKYRTGPWNGLGFSGIYILTANRFYNFTFVLNQREVYYQYDIIDTSVLMRLVLQPNGNLDRFIWIESKQEWNLYLTGQKDLCEQYALCGRYAGCNVDKSPVCECLKGFEPTSRDQWRKTDWSQGCRHTIPLDCEPGEGFKKYTNLKLPDTQGSWYNQTMTLVECEKMCKSNCSCTAYTNLNISGTGSGCLLWFGDLIDINTLPENGDTLYIRLSASELDSIENSRSSSAGRRVRVLVPITSVVLVILVSICLYYRFYSIKQQPQGTTRNTSAHDPENISGEEDLELPLFSLSTIIEATNNFSMNNKLGEGGYGPVYKGLLEDEQAIAVKRLANTSTQGLHEFKNEVILISKLQHRNLVKLLGCCIEEAEKMLIYEYMSNKGLDSFIFDETQRKLLNWSVRYDIINGIARGLLYLHQDSRLRIIHRDLKVSNILLDTNMNPKISDFGMARIFKGNQIEANTNRVVGTYGYMAPEYAGNGNFSIKSDVYSFGVLVLEIVCGEKNRGFAHQEHYNNLIGHAWGLHNEGRSLQLVDKCLVESINISQVQRSIHVGLLCVQRHPEDRPTMPSVIMMLVGESPLPSPKKPGFYVGKTKEDTTESSISYETNSNNVLSITMLNGR